MADDRVYDGFASFPKGRLDEHLPECLGTASPEDGDYDCICERLRAAEQRVLDRAREAVAATPSVPYMYAPQVVLRTDALAAIDALKGKP